MSTYSYTKQVNLDILKQEIENSNITIALDSITLSGIDGLNIVFKTSISSEEETVLTNLVTNHVYMEYTPQDPIEVKLNNVEIDLQGRQINRVAVGSKGWTYLADTIELETCNLNGLFHQDYLGNSISTTSVKFFDSNNTELTTQEDIDLYCIKTEISVKYSYDYELIGGSIFQSSTPNQDVRVSAIGGILELGSNYVKELARNINLKKIPPGEKLETDGRATKYMKKDIEGVPYQGNQLKFIFKHPEGFKHSVMIVLEYYRA